jgi:hypothetical protein
MAISAEPQHSSDADGYYFHVLVEFFPNGVLFFGPQFSKKHFRV